MLAEPVPSSYIQKYRASNGFPTAPAQFDPHCRYGNPPGGSGSVSWAAPRAAAWSRPMAKAVKGARPRAVRSRFVATKICCPGDNWAQLEGSAIGGSPSWFRPLAMACRAAPTHAEESSYAVPEQLERKLGCGAMLAGSTPSASAAGLVEAGAGGAVGVGTTEGPAVGLAGLGGVVVCGLIGIVVAGEEAPRGEAGLMGPEGVARERADPASAPPGWTNVRTRMTISPIARRNPNPSQRGPVAPPSAICGPGPAPIIPGVSASLRRRLSHHRCAPPCVPAVILPAQRPFLSTGDRFASPPAEFSRPAPPPPRGRHIRDGVRGRRR